MPGPGPPVDLMPPQMIRAARAPLALMTVSAAWSLWAVSASSGVGAPNPIEAAWTGGALIPVVLDAHVQLWRLLCAGWLHVDWVHAALNAPGLFAAGLALARLRSGATVWVVWGLGAILGSVASWQLTRTWALGASGGNAALAAAVLWIAWRRWDELAVEDRRLAIVGSVPWLVLLLLPRDGPIDHAAHLAGALAGPLLVGAGRRIAAALMGAQAIAFGLMVHCAHRPPLDVVHVPTDTAECASPRTDGLLVYCQTPKDPPADGPIEGRAHHRWHIGSYTLLAPPGPRANRALAQIRGRFFDGSPDLR